MYATGFSNGAGFTYLLWAERPGVFAAFAAVAGRLRPSVRPTTPKPVLHVAGARDGQVPLASQLETIDIVRRVNGVTARTSCGADCTLYQASDRPPVMTWVHPGGHEYPVTTEDRIAKFFRDFQLR